MEQNEKQKVVYCAAIVDAVVYLSGMTKTGLCKILPPIPGQTETLHFIVNKSGTNLLVNLSFDADKNPIIATNNNISLRWFAVIKWACVLLGPDKIVFHGDEIDVGDNVSVPSIVIEIPVCEKVASIIAKHKVIGIGFSDSHLNNTVYVTSECKITFVS